MKFGFQRRVSGAHTIPCPKTQHVTNGACYRSSMQLQATVCYNALKAHDHRFDGVFFTCVTSTKIYCRPICPAIIPKFENCRFVASPMEAEKAGFRPCLRCRPELAPSMANDNTASPARKLATYIDETLLMDETLSGVANKFGFSERQLRRIFQKTWGIEPRQYLTSRRLLFAKQLLQDSNLPITDIAFSAGFNSRGRLTVNMQRVYGFTPERLRKELPSNNKNMSAQPLLLRADYRPPFNWEALLQFLQGRATPLEWIKNNAYCRMVDGHVVTVRNVPAKNHLLVEIPIELSRQAHAILSRVRRLFDLDANPLIIAAMLSRDPLLARLIQQNPGLRMPGCWDSFEMLLRVVIGQQVSVAGATTVMRRFVTHIGVTSESVARSSPETIVTIGMPLKRATTIWHIARLVQSKQLSLEEKNPEKFYAQLVAIPGIGPWTAEYLRMRVLGWPDAFPAGDLGLQKAIAPGLRYTEKQLRERAATWQPWRGYATVLLWKSLENQGG